MKHLNRTHQTQAKLSFVERSWHYARFFTASLLQRISNTLQSGSHKKITPSTQVEAFHILVNAIRIFRNATTGSLIKLSTVIFRLQTDFAGGKFV